MRWYVVGGGAQGRGGEMELVARVHVCGGGQGEGGGAEPAAQVSVRGGRGMDERWDARDPGVSPRNAPPLQVSVALKHKPGSAGSSDYLKF